MCSHTCVLVHLCFHVCLYMFGHVLLALVSVHVCALRSVCTCVFAHVCACAWACVCAHVCLSMWALSMHESPSYRSCARRLLFTDLTDKARSVSSTTYTFALIVQYEELQIHPQRNRKIFRLAMCLPTESRQKRSGSYKPRLLPHLEWQSVSH